MKCLRTVQGRVLESLWESWKDLLLVVSDGPHRASLLPRRFCEPSSEGGSGGRMLASTCPEEGPEAVIFLICDSLMLTNKKTPSETFPLFLNSRGWCGWGVCPWCVSDT